jgi:serine/threonine-protein kinase
MKRHILPSRRFFPAVEAIRILISVLDALDYAHRQGIIHRDVKPANILIETHSKRPLIADFGIAKVLRGPEVNAPRITGTPIYMAPEQITGGPVDGRADIYTLGVTLFELLVTNLPLPSHDTALDLLKMKIVLKDRMFQKKPSAMNPQIGPEMDAIVSRAVAYDPEKRYASCREFIKSLISYQERFAEEPYEYPAERNCGI